MMLAFAAARIVALSILVGPPAEAGHMTRPVTTRPAPSPEEVDRVVTRLADADPSIRLAAVEVLAQADVPRARTALIQASHDEYRPVKLAAYRALVTLRAPEFVGMVLKALYEGDESVRLMVLPWVGEVRPPRAAPAITGLMLDETASEAIRLACARSLASLREETTVPGLAAILNAPDMPPAVTDRVRIEAARTLGILGGSFAIDELLTAAVAAAMPVRCEAVVALAAYAAQPRPGARIIAAAKASDPATRRRFLAAARDSGRASSQVFDAFIDDAEPAVRVEAAAGLCALRRAAGIELLIELLGAEQPAAEEARAVLARYTGQSLGQDQTAWRAWWQAHKPTFQWPSVEATDPNR